MLFANVFLVKLKLSNTSFSALLHTDELFELTRRAITDCASIATGARSAAGTSGFILSAIYNSFRANSEGGLTSAAPSRGPSSVGGPSVAVTASASGSGPSRKGSIAGTDGLGLIDMGNTNSNTNYNALPPATTSGSEMTLAPEAMSTPGASAPQGPFFSQHAPAPTHMRPPGLSSGANTPSAFAGMHHAMGGHSGGDGQLDGGFFDSLLTDSLLVSQGEAGFLPNMCVCFLVLFDAV